MNSSIILDMVYISSDLLCIAAICRIFTINHRKLSKNIADRYCFRQTLLMTFGQT